jgi:hypothetical protein
VIILKWTFKRYLLKFLIAIAAIIIAMTMYKAVLKPAEQIRIITPNEQVSDSKYIISEDYILSKLRAKSQIVSMEQTLHKTDTFVDDNILGERHTELSLKGKYKFGLNTKDIEIQHIDSNNGIIYIKLGKPTLISLDIPYDQIQFDKKQGYFRLAMSEEEEKKFYKAVRANIEHELVKNKELLKVADLMNRDVVEELLKLIPEVKSVVFQ